ncbi:hypothetical protein [Chitinophaga rhizosphaerae]|uniref:hypothetical protein n=1 Tax=Chitinophaga rhizosphaerae TaxID=1864947 RepID=UPI000F80B088|nr:hypothetical protein [Chitinophaga rhizosphaerae]
MKLFRRIFLLGASIGCTGIACNKNSLELPPVSSPPAELRLQAKIDGIAAVEFIFQKTTVPGSDTVRMFIRNLDKLPLSGVRYVAELCNAATQNFDNCPLQVTDVIPALAAGGEQVRLAEWVNTGMVLDSQRINVGIVSAGGRVPHPLCGIYGNVSAGFQGADTITKYYGQIRGYVLADGTATFRLKSAFGKNVNAKGLFTGLQAFDGELLANGLQPIPFSLDSVTVGGTRKPIDTTGGTCIFRMKLQTVYDSQVNFIFSQTSKQ